jgi:tetratricopeptide (TPR) repeat protein
MKKLLVVFLLFVNTLIASGYTRPNVYVIDAGKNAFFHNNLGLRCVDEKNYSGAIQEFKIAISLNPNTQSTAVYYNNLGDAYMTIGLFKYAQDCYEKAITQYSLNFRYYQNLAKCYKAQNLVGSKIKIYASRQKNPLNMVMLGLLYVEKGDISMGIVKLDEFCFKEPDLIITKAIKNYIKELVN